MLLDPSHLRFIIATTVAAVVATAAYVPYAASRLNGPSGGSWLGLVFGGLGFALMIYAGLLGARRKVPTWRRWPGPRRGVGPRAARASDGGGSDTDRGGGRPAEGRLRP